MSSPNGNADSSGDFWSLDYVNEDHIRAFANALSSSDNLPTEGDVSPASPRSPPIPLDPTVPLNLGPSLPAPSHRTPSRQGSASGLPSLGPPTWKYGPDNGSLLGGDLNGNGDASGSGRVHKLSATSDFAPIHQRVSRRRSTRQHQGLTYNLIRWPLLGFIFLIISLEFGAYVLTRQTVNVFEWLVAWRGHKAALRRGMRQAKTYDEWVRGAKRMDAYLGFDEWKDMEEDGYYDHILVKRVRRTLTRLRVAKDTRGVMDALAVCVRSNFAGTESVKMYSEAFYGTKKLVESHLQEVAACLDLVRTATDVSIEEKRAFFRAVNKNYGSSALCLSGGASFGYYHFGVVKAFLEADLLPRVITGTSAGGLVAALLCTRTNVELKLLLVPELADKITACEDSFWIWFKRFRETGARFSTLQWARKAMFFTMGSLTFKEAYERSGRALNVSVVPSDRHSPTILLNHLTAPNCIIWSAIIASAAVPGILNPVVLMAKDRNGHVKPHNLGGSRFKDGSLREDIPLGSLHTQFNCNFSIVSQTNPHIHLFFFAPKGSVGRPVAHRKGKGWRGGFILSALESYIKLDLSKHFKVIRDLDLLPQILQSDWSGVFLQRFSGDLTLTPRSTVGDWFRILSDPDRLQLSRMLMVGQRVTWPALHMVKNRMIVERAILRGRTEVRAAKNREQPTTDMPTDSSVHRPFLEVAIPVPIESDADAGFIRRTRRMRHRSEPPLELEALPPAPSAPSAIGTRRRKGFARHARRGQEAVLEGDEGPSSGSTLVENGSAPMAASPVTFADTVRHFRAASSSAFAGLSSPFRSRSMDQTTESPPLPGPGANAGYARPRRRSQAALARWFGGKAEDESSSSDETEERGDYRTTGEGSVSGPSADEMPVFGQMGSAIVDDADEGEDVESDDGVERRAATTGSEDDGLPELRNRAGKDEGIIPILGGERVGEKEIHAGAAAGEGLIQGRGREQQYSPPGQDVE